MEIGDNEVGLSSPSKGFNDLANTVEEWIPTCDDKFKPVIGNLFDTLEEGGNFYKRYAHTAGFSVRNSSETKDKYGVKWKYFLCSREGFKIEKNVVLPELIISENSLPKSRKRKLTREGCNAKIAFKRTIDGKYEIAKFYEGHTHALVTPKKKQFLRSARNVSKVHKNLWFSCKRASVGTSKSYELMKEQVGSYENIGCTKRYPKLFKRFERVGQRL
jgi:hypothetical protein